MLKLGVKKVKDDNQAIDPSLVYGTVNELMSKFQEENKLKGVEFRPKVGTNVGKTGSLMMFIIREKNPSKKKENLFVSDDLFLSGAMSDAIRSGEVHVSALKDFVVVQHTNNSESANPGATYPLIVRPTEVQNDEDLDKFAITSESEITKAYERDTTSIEDILSSMQV